MKKIVRNTEMRFNILIREILHKNTLLLFLMLAFKNHMTEMYFTHEVRGWNSPPTGNGKKSASNQRFSQTTSTLILIDTP